MKILKFTLSFILSLLAAILFFGSSEMLESSTVASCGEEVSPAPTHTPESAAYDAGAAYNGDNDVLYDVQSKSSIDMDTLTVNDLADYILSYYDSDSMTSISLDQLQKHYDISIEYLDGFAVYTSKIDGSADEFAIFHLHEESSLQPVLNAVYQRLEQKNDTFRKLENSESLKTSNSIVFCEGNFVILVIGDMYSVIETNLDELIE